MKKSIRSLAILGVCALSLTACGKVSFADFQSKASEALKKDVPYTTAVLTGSIKASSSSNSSEQKVNSKFNVKGHVLTPASISDTAYAIIFTTSGLGTFSAAENTDYTYYAGSVFKVTYSASDEDGNKASSSISWNEYGLLTSLKGRGTGSDSKTTYNLTVKYSK